MFSATLFTLLVQFAFYSFAFAAPAVEAAGHHGNSIQWGTGGGIIGFIVLILDIMVWIEVLKSNRPPLHKLLWCLGVFLFPVVGLIVYWLFSNRAAHTGGSGYEPIA